ncbi:MAG: hypothetical protein MH825_06275 [Cyanobacteria bacterium]|nr:hypothetical protein [Cyanobacteriota bacterium]
MVHRHRGAAMDGRSRRWAMVLGVGLLGAGFGAIAALGAADRPPETATATGTCPAGQRPAQIEVEGEPQDVCLTSLRDGGSGLTVDLSPGDFQVRPLRSATTSGWRLVAQGGGWVNPQAYLQIEVDRGGDRAIGPWLRATLAEHPTWQMQPLPPEASAPGNRLPYRWAAQGVHFRAESAAPDGAIAGQILMGRIQGRSVRAIIHLPLEYGEGYGPRIHQILNSLRVTD